MASSVTVEKVPTCFFMPVSISSIFSPERRPYSAFQSFFLSWAGSEHGIRIRKHANAALRILNLSPFASTKLLEIPFVPSETRKIVHSNKQAFGSCLHALPSGCSHQPIYLLLGCRTVRAPTWAFRNAIVLQL